MSQPVPAGGMEAASGAAGHAGAGLDPAGELMHHILDSRLLELPAGLGAISLDTTPLIGVDLGLTKHVVMMWIAGAILLVLFRVAARSTGQIVPSGVRNALEVFILFIRDEVARKAIHPGADRYVGFLLSTFFFILTCNLLGLVPGMATATGNISVTAGLAVAAFVMIQWGGIREYGFVGHAKNLVPHGLPVWLAPVIALIELLSQFIRPFALSVRLFANMMAGHVVIGAFVFLIFIMGSMFGAAIAWAVSPVSVAFALFVHFLELLVAFLQAYIFTMLTATFIGMSVHPAH